MNGYFMLPRSLLEWGLYGDQNSLLLLLHLLLIYDPEQGAIKTTVGQLSKETGLSVQSVRTSLKKLLGNKQINKQKEKEETDREKRKKQRIKEINKEEREAHIKQDLLIEHFKQSLIPYRQKYGDAMLFDFFNYWTELNRSKTKMRYQLQPTWEIGKRLATWARNTKTYKHGNIRRYNQETAADRRADAASLVARLLEADDVRSGAQ